MPARKDNEAKIIQLDPLDAFSFQMGEVLKKLNDRNYPMYTIGALSDVSLGILKGKGFINLLKINLKSE